MWIESKKPDLGQSRPTDALVEEEGLGWGTHQDLICRKEARFNISQKGRFIDSKVESHTYRCTCRHLRWLKKGRVKSQSPRQKRGTRKRGTDILQDSGPTTPSHLDPLRQLASCWAPIEQRRVPTGRERV